MEAITPDIRTGPFHARQVALGASFYEDLGSLWTRAFGDPEGEYWAVRRDVGLWDVSALVKWRFTGPDALVAADRLTTRSMLGAAPGVIRYGMVLSEDGRMLDEGTNCVVGEDEVYFMGNDERPPFEQHIRNHTADLRVEIENATWRIPNVSVQGPGSFRLLSGLCTADLASLKYFRLIPEPVEVAGVRGLLTRTGFSGEIGYEFFLLDGVDGAETLWDAIAGAGARPFGLDAVEMLRVEAGLVIQEEDYWVGETDPLDLSLERFIDLDHYFVGREAVTARVGSPLRRMVTLSFDGDEVPEAGTVVARKGEPAGVIRSAVRSPRFGVIALAVMEREHVAYGGSVDAIELTATVGPVPIDDPQKLRPRADPRSPITV